VPRRPAFSVLVIPYALDAFAEVAFALVRRSEDAGWHVRSGWGARSESPPEAARRVAGTPCAANLLALDSRAMVVADGMPACCELPEYAFALRADPAELPSPTGHEQLWVSYQTAVGLLSRRAERDALWELRHRLGLAPACR
jgi:hypothetical protein